MYNRIIKVCEALEREKSKSKRWSLTLTFISLYDWLTIEEKAIIDKKYGRLRFIEKDLLMEDVLMNNVGTHLNSFEKLKNKFTENEFKFYEMLSSRDISQEEVIDICEEIVNNIGGEEYLKLFKEIVKKENIFTSNLDEGLGLCVNNLAFGDSYIFLDKKASGNTMSISTLMHEFGHAYENRYMYCMNSEQQVQRYNDIFVEVMSIFFSRISLDYCINNHIYLEDSQKVLNEEYLNTFVCFDELNFVIKAIQKEKMTYNYLGEYFYVKDEFLGDDEIYLYSMYTDLSGNYLNCLKYGYGGLIAEYFFDIYKNDKKEGLRAIKNFLSNQFLLYDREMFESINLEESDFSFLDQGLKENMEYMRKRYKW